MIYTTKQMNHLFKSTEYAPFGNGTTFLIGGSATIFIDTCLKTQVSLNSQTY